MSAIRKKKRDTPDGAESREKDRLDDRAVEKAVTNGGPRPDQGTKSVLPGPPIPPELQDDIRERSGDDGKSGKARDRSR